MWPRRPSVRVRLPAWAVWTIGLAALVVALAAIPAVVDRAALARAARAAASQPGSVAAVLAVYGGAFVLRAVAWRRALPRLPVRHALAAIHVALLGNHLAPFRLGEPLRVVSVTRRVGVDLATAAASTVSLRAADVAGLALLALAAAGLVGGVPPGPLVGLAALAVAVLVGGQRWLGRLAARGAGARRLDVQALVLSTLAWGFEAVVVFAAASWVGVPLTPAEAVAVTTVTVAAQTLALAPGGIGVYEAAGTAALTALGVEPGVALAVAVSAHALKYVYALAAGAVFVAWPAPGMLGRLRLPRVRPVALPDVRPAAAAPVVLFLPAHDEEATVGDVVTRAPVTVRGRPVVVAVIDDGSSDATADRARAAGAEVVAHGRNRGLGAAVRTGLDWAVARGAAAVAFCDADGEYAPEELERLVGPILDGEADYVVGSRFDGRIERMLPHRRFGNHVLTLALRCVARTPLTDGQSGYRALSPGAAATAEIAHDFNYAQVLTLDLLARGARYVETPISYAFRAHGRSFVRLGRYLRAVTPAVYRVLNRAGRAPAAHA